MAKPRTGNIQPHGRVFRIRYVDTDGVRRHESYPTLEEAERTLSERLKITADQLPPYTPLKHKGGKLRSVAQCAGVYFLWCRETGLTKIGQSSGAGRRIADLTTASSTHLWVIGFVPTYHHKRAEKCIHAFLKRRHVRGEWFNVNPYQIECAIGHWFRTQGALPTFVEEVPSSVLMEVM